jgi:hypothetical protein
MGEISMVVSFSVERDDGVHAGTEERERVCVCEGEMEGERERNI